MGSSLGLRGLPAEVLVLLAAALPSSDFFHLRLASRDLRDKTAAVFHRRFFRKRCVSLERGSLQNLVDISRDPVLCQVVSTVELCIDHLVHPRYYLSRQELKEEKGIYDYALETAQEDLGRLQTLQALGGGERTIDTARSTVLSVRDQSEGDRHAIDIAVGTGDRRAVNYNAYRQRWFEQLGFGGAGLDVAYLAAAFVNLRRCRAVGVNDFVRPWGTASLSRDLRFMPNRFISSYIPESIPFASRVIRTLLSAVAASRLALERFYVTFGSMKESCTRVTPYMLTIPPVLMAEVGMQLAAVLDIHLLLDPEPSRTVGEAYATGSSDWVAVLVRFLSLFAKLSQLVLAFEPRDRYGRFSRLSETLYMPCLAVLRLECLDCTTPQLLCLLRRHKKTLRKVELESLTLTGDVIVTGGWSSVVRMAWNELMLDKLYLGDCGTDDTTMMVRNDICDEEEAWPRVFVARGRAECLPLAERLQGYEEISRRRQSVVGRTVLQ
ncbi:hypothetical protein LX36DRAFT_661361 [Colletotrichum falcatum]|nr:hypothetical protein LX36DRAFT_661361 [Colletotrichum falcatum]